MSVEIVTVQEDGRIQIPETMLEELGWKPGIRLRWEVLSNTEFRLVPVEASVEEHNLPRLVRKNGHWVVPGKVDYPVEDLIEQDREERIQELIRRAKVS